MRGCALQLTGRACTHGPGNADCGTHCCCARMQRIASTRAENLRSDACLDRTFLSPYWSRKDLRREVIFSTIQNACRKLRIRSQFRIQSFDIMNFRNTEFTMHHTCNNKNDLKVVIDFQSCMKMVPKCRSHFMHDRIPAVLSARTRDCRRRPDLIARAENHNSTQPGCHVASRTRSTDLKKMT